jgi:hypothetical protein
VSRLLSPSLRRFLGGDDEGGDDGDDDDSENNNEDDYNESEKDNNDSAPYRVLVSPGEVDSDAIMEDCDRQESESDFEDDEDIATRKKERKVTCLITSLSTSGPILFKMTT